MGLFAKVLEKLGIRQAQAAPAPSAQNAPPPAASPGGSSSTGVPAGGAPQATGASAGATSGGGTGVPQGQGGGAPGATAPTAIPVVDVVAQLEQRAKSNPQKLNWRTSIVDLLKLLDIDSSLTARKELATELGCPPDLMNDSAKMNMWLHKAVLARIAANGGNVPRDLLD